jgi:3-dehydroquinate dehydratase-1
MDAGASLVKIAAMPHSADDVMRMLRFCNDTPHPMVAITMGELGTLSRVFAPLFGSLFSYAFLGDSVAPGQLSVDKLAEEFRLFYPSRRQ